MRIRHCVAVSVATLVVGLVACGGSASSSCGSYFDAVVSLEQKCNSSGQVDTTQKGNFQSFCAAIAKAPGANNLAGQIDHCASLVNGSDCNTLGSALNCKIAGSLADGAACGIGLQCAGGLCNTSNGTPAPNSEVVCGKCASYLAIGAACGSGGSCDSSTSECTGGTCVAYAQSGESCASAPCGQNLTCDQQSKTCKPNPTKGEACPNFVCQAPYRCIQATCADAVQAGGACPTGAECASGLTCNQTSKTCKAPTLVGAGQPCGFVTNQIVDCQTGLACQSDGTNQSTCVVPKNAGDACTVGKKECGFYLYCVNGTCAIPDYSVCQ